MKIALIQAKYDYKMSYLDEWATAWKTLSQNVEIFNILNLGSVKNLAKTSGEFDLIVILHSATADSNLWMKKIIHAIEKRRCPVILFVGNEYSNPFLSMEERLEDISKLNPDILATQLALDSGRILYAGICKQVVEIPHALPRRRFEKPNQNFRKIDLGFRGYEYPWYLLDTDRNDCVTEVGNFFAKKGFRVDMSFSERLGKEDWYTFLKDSKLTVASEGGSRFVFLSDQVWTSALRLLEGRDKKSYIRNDFLGSNQARRLPYPVKEYLKKIGRILGREQGATANFSEKFTKDLFSEINIEGFPYVNGKALTSRHMDAIACGTWQILSPGEYNLVLKAGQHYTEWNSSNPEGSLLHVNESIRDAKPLEIYEDLYQEHSYASRIQKILDIVRP
jgi:hypothetical protein